MGETSCKRCGGTGEIAPAPFERTRCPDCASPPSSSSPGDDAFREALDAAIQRAEAAGYARAKGHACLPIPRSEVERVHREEVAKAIEIAAKEMERRDAAEAESEQWQGSNAALKLDYQNEEAARVAAERALAEARAERDRLREQRDNAWKDLEHVGNVLGGKIKAGQDFAHAVARVMNLGAEKLAEARARCETLGNLHSTMEQGLAAAEAREAEATKAKDGAYAERNQVVALLARMALALGWRAGLRAHEPDPDPTWDADWRNVVAIDLPTGQVTWHYHDSDRPLFASLPPYPAAWDGHGTPEKYRRVRAALAPRSSPAPVSPGTDTNGGAPGSVPTEHDDDGGAK